MVIVVVDAAAADNDEVDDNDNGYVENDDNDYCDEKVLLLHKLSVEDVQSCLNLCEASF